jgi:hypothetical protein
LGPPGTSASVVFVPSGATRVMRGPKISTTSTLPSAIATGPSVKRSPDVISIRVGSSAFMSANLTRQDHIR